MVTMDTGDSLLRGMPNQGHRVYKCMECDVMGTKEEVQAHMQQKKMVVREFGRCKLCWRATSSARVRRL